MLINHPLTFWLRGVIVYSYNEKHMKKVVVKPKSSKAKNRLANIMEGNPVCIVEQDTGGELFLASENRKYFMWVSTRTGSNRFGDKADAHWEVITEIKDVIL
jgi:hypothetical protein